MKRFKLPKKAAHIGAWIMPHDTIDDICDYWNNPTNGEIKSKGRYGKQKISPSTKDSIDLSISPNNFDKPWDTYRKYLQDCVDDYLLQYPDADKVQLFDIREKYNIQWYPKGGGYKEWHHENAGNYKEAHRHLVFMTYCNDLSNAGTHFKYQNITTPSIKGLTLIWPAVFTHTHKGQITEEHEKMIVTGWFSFNDVFDKLGEQ
jgi:hypothetical protein